MLYRHGERERNGRICIDKDVGKSKARSSGYTYQCNEEEMSDTGVLSDPGKY